MKSGGGEEMRLDSARGHPRVMLSKLHVDFRNAKHALLVESYSRSDARQVEPAVSDGDKNKLYTENIIVRAPADNQSRLTSDELLRYSVAPHDVSVPDAATVTESAATADDCPSPSVTEATQPTDRSLSRWNVPTPVTENSSFAVRLASHKTKKQKSKTAAEKVSDKSELYAIATQPAAEKLDLPAKNSVKSSENSSQFALKANKDAVTISDVDSQSKTALFAIPPFLFDDDDEDKVDSMPLAKRRCIKLVTHSRKSRKSKKSRNVGVSGASPNGDLEHKLNIQKLKQRRKIKRQRDDKVWTVQKKLLLSPSDEQIPKSGRRRKKKLATSAETTTSKRGQKSSKFVGTELKELPDLATVDITDDDYIDVSNAWQHDEVTRSDYSRWWLDISGAGLSSHGSVTESDRADSLKLVLVEQAGVSHTVDALLSALDASVEPIRTDNRYCRLTASSADRHCFTTTSKHATYIDSRFGDSANKNVSVRVCGVMEEESLKQFGCESLVLAMLTPDDVSELQQQVRREEMNHRQARKAVLLLHADVDPVAKQTSVTEAMSAVSVGSLNSTHSLTECSGSPVDYHKASSSAGQVMKVPVPGRSEADASKSREIDEAVEAQQVLAAEATVITEAGDTTDVLATVQNAELNQGAESDDDTVSYASDDQTELQEDVRTSAETDAASLSVACISELDVAKVTASDSDGFANTDRVERQPARQTCERSCVSVDSTQRISRDSDRVSKPCIVSPTGATESVAVTKSHTMQKSAKTSSSRKDSITSRDSDKPLARKSASVSKSHSPQKSRSTHASQGNKNSSSDVGKLHASSSHHRAVKTDAANASCFTAPTTETRHRLVPTTTESAISSCKADDASTSALPGANIHQSSKQHTKQTDKNVNLSGASESTSKQLNVTEGSKHVVTASQSEAGGRKSHHSDGTAHGHHRSQHHHHSAQSSAHKNKDHKHSSASSAAKHNSSKSCTTTVTNSAANHDRRTQKTKVLSAGDGSVNSHSKHRKHTSANSQRSSHTKVVDHKEQAQVVPSPSPKLDNHVISSDSSDQHETVSKGATQLTRKTQTDSSNTNVDLLATTSDQFPVSLVSAEANQTTGATTATEMKHTLQITHPPVMHVTAENPPQCVDIDKTSTSVDLLITTVPCPLPVSVAECNSSVVGAEANKCLEAAINTDVSLLPEIANMSTLISVSQIPPDDVTSARGGGTPGLSEHPSTKQHAADSEVALIMSSAGNCSDTQVLPLDFSIPNNERVASKIRPVHCTSGVVFDRSPMSHVDVIRNNEDIQSPSPTPTDSPDDVIRSPSPTENLSSVLPFRVVETSWDVRLASPCEIASPDASDDDADDSLEGFDSQRDVCSRRRDPVTIPLTIEEGCSCCMFFQKEPRNF